jgi:hypothetical protein
MGELVFFAFLHFDSMSHALLLRKLRDLFGLSSVVCSLIGSFLDSHREVCSLLSYYSLALSMMSFYV